MIDSPEGQTHFADDATLDYIRKLEARIEAADKQKTVGHLSEDGYFMAAPNDAPKYVDFYTRPPIASERELELLAVIEQMREALEAALVHDYQGYYKGRHHREQGKEALALTPDLSALKEDRAWVLEEAAESDLFDDDYQGTEHCRGILRRMAEERRKP